MRTSYKAMGRAIKDFCNNWLETKDEVKLVKAHGLKREKPTLAMPSEMVDAVSELVEKRLLKFGPKAERLTTKEEAS